MKFTISDCISRINQALNYPAITYEDVSHFFDQAIVELNTSLRIALPTVSEMRDEHTYRISDSPNAVIISSNLSNNLIPSTSTVPTEVPAADSSKVVYYNGSVRPYDNSLYIFKNGGWFPTREAYGIVPGSDEGYEAISVGFQQAVWTPISIHCIKEFSLTDYLPTDWIILFIIPYVCFKFAVRNGDSGALFSDEFTQGFQQLQTSYNVPNSVTLSSVAHYPAYSKQVEKNLNNLNIRVPTRAIINDMLVPNGIRPINGVGAHDVGGWGI